MYKDDSKNEMKSSPVFNRRSFLKSVGGGVVVLFTTAPRFALAEESHAASASVADNFNAYLRIGDDGRVTCFTGKIEMGQGIVTSLPQMLADELDVAVEMIDMVMGDTDRCPFDQGTWGSLTTRVFGPELRAAGAQARSILLDLASKKLAVPLNRLEVRDGVVFDRSDQSTQITYAALTRGQSIVGDMKSPAPVKPASDYKFMGQSFKRRDAVEKVTGKAQYAADIRLPGMLIARLLRPVSHGAKLNGLDTSVAEAIEGVRVIQDGDLVAVLHEKRHMADRALLILKPDYSVPKSTLTEENIHEHLMSMAPDGVPIADGGDLAAGERLAVDVIEHTYQDAYVAHAPMEPHAALASWEDGKMTVWASTQSPFGLKRELVTVLGLPEDKVRVMTPFVGGGFGGKGSSPQGVQAARLSKIAGRPVQVFWTREDEFFWDQYRPASIVKIRSGLTREGKPAFWDYRVYFAGARGSEQQYDIPNHRTVAHSRGWNAPPGSHPFATGAWRAPGASSNVFAREQHIDIMAAKAGVDPLEFRLKNCSHPKYLGVLNAAADRFGWKPATGPSGRGVGISCGIDADTVVATMVEVDVDRNSGQIRVKRVVCAQDMGQVVNPAGATLQIEGCIAMGLGYALTEAQRFRGGEILELNFYSYELPLFSTQPKIETVLIDSADPAPHGGGEPAIINMGAAIANAVFDAIGVRIFELPMTPKRVKAALA
ncbi:MAG: molybdopterin-dependent oxidoreductase [Xanthomonadales bacterium]|nr:molybdopterin-dependent oxidoreductase [Xanthomonadales bacterium]